MPRLQIDPTLRIEPSTGLPYNTHPLYLIRKSLILVAALGCILNLSSTAPYGSPIHFTTVFFLAATIFFACCDLTAYALRKAQHPDEDPKWPKTLFIFGDVLLALILQFLFWAAVVDIEQNPYWSHGVLPAWAALTPLYCSLNHAYSFWKQLMARYKAKWLASLTVEPCARCGYQEAVGEIPNRRVPRPRPRPQQQATNIFTYAGPSAAAVVTPQSQGSAMEEGLLIGSDLDSSYGTVRSVEESLVDDSKPDGSQKVSKPIAEPAIAIEPQEIVVGKGKKKRVVTDGGAPQAA